MAITFMSSLFGILSTKSESNIIKPPGATISSNLSKEGLFITTTVSGLVTIGDPTGESDRTTEQLAVPPLISGP